MSKTFNIVYGCDVFNKDHTQLCLQERCITRPIVPSSCPYCYVRYKMYPTRGLSDEQFSHPYVNWKALDDAIAIKTSEVFVGSIMGDFMSPSITNEEIAKIFELIESKASQHLFLLLTKNTYRYINFLEWYKKPLPCNVWCGTSIESERYKDRADILRMIKQYSPHTHLWIEVEPILGNHTNTDFSGIEYISVSLLGEDQIYTSESGQKFNSYFKEEWVLSLLNNPTVDRTRVSIYQKITHKCKSPLITQHANYSMYKELQRMNSQTQSSDFSPIW